MFITHHHHQPAHQLSIAVTTLPQASSSGDDPGQEDKWNVVCMMGQDITGSTQTQIHEMIFRSYISKTKRIANIIHVGQAYLTRKNNKKMYHYRLQ